MNLNLQNLSLNKQAIIVFAAFIVLAILNLIVIANFQSELDETALKIEAAKDVQSLPEQIAAACQLYAEGNEKSKPKINALTSRFEKALVYFSPEEEEIVAKKEIEEIEEAEIDSIPIQKELRIGLIGKIDHQWSKIKVQLENLLFEPATIDTIVQESKEVPLYDSLNTITTETSQKVLNIANPKIQRANNYIQASTKELATTGKALVKKQNVIYDSKSDRLTYIALIFLGLTIIIVVLVLAAIYKKIFQPITELDEVASAVSDGDFSIKSNYTADNEIGKIARSINKITDNLRNATSFVNNIENGKLDEEFEGVDENQVNKSGLAGALLTMRDQMKKVEEEERERKWSTEGLAKFVDILRSTSDDVYQLGDIIISNLVQYTKSNQGGIYILNEEEEENKTLELISLYAFDTKKYDKKIYRLGEGLVGQTYLERKTIYLLEVPQEYITITSGLGGANPTSILLVPLKINEDIYGVMELASFYEYKNHEIEFVEKLAESIASTIAGVKNNQRTKRLLEDSQALTEQMQAQEEEMRQNMEELSATQDEMSRKEVEMSAQLTAINNSLATAEFDMDGLLLNANNIYIKAHGYQQIEDIREKPFSSLSAEDTTSLWQALRNGVSQSGDFIKQAKSGERMEINATYTPVKNKNGELYKVIELILSTGTAVSQPATDTAEWKQMKEVEEELRQNLEELEITQEQMDQKLKLSEATLETLDSVVKIITFSFEGKIITINQATVSQLGFERSEMIDQNIQSFIEQDILTEIAQNVALQKELTLTGKGETINITAEIRQNQNQNLVYIIWI